MFQCINLFPNGQSLLSLWHNNKLVYPPELSRIVGFCTHSNKIFLGEDPQTPLSNRIANHLKKLKNTYPNLPHHFSDELKIKWSLYVLFENSIVYHFFANGCLKEQRKVLEKSWKCTSKVLEKSLKKVCHDLWEPCFHIFDFFSRTAWWILMKLGRDEVLMVPYKRCCFSTRSAQGRIQGGAKIGHGGSPSLRNFFFRPKGYSDKPNA